MIAAALRKQLTGRGWLLTLALIASGCFLSPSPDIPGAESDGGLPTGTGGAIATGGAGPCLLVQIPAETWCEGDDLWARNPSCQGDTWAVSPCPHGCTEGAEAGQASCQGEGFGGGGLGGQPGGSP